MYVLIHVYKDVNLLKLYIYKWVWYICMATFKLHAYPIHIYNIIYLAIYIVIAILYDFFLAYT